MGAVIFTPFEFKIICFSIWNHYFSTRILSSSTRNHFFRRGFVILTWIRYFFRKFVIFAWIRFFNVNSFFVAKSLLYDVKCTHNLAKIKLTRVSQTQNDQYVKKRQIFEEFIAETQKTCKFVVNKIQIFHSKIVVRIIFIASP